MLSIPDPLRPYLATIRVTGYCVLAAALLIGGCKMGQRMERADADSKVAAAGKERDKANQAAADYLAAANACGQVVADINEETRLAKARADEWKRAAEIADARASQAAEDAAAKVAAAEKALQAAKAKPACASQLAMVLCPEIPLL